jgi:two-component system, response regulator / RNA-binding antiterminator
MPAATRARLSVLIVTEPDAQRSQDAHAIAQALTDAGSLVLGVRAGDATLPEAVEQLKPDVVVVRSDSGVRDVLEHIAVATQHARRPIALFTNSEDRPTMRQALGAGVSAYVVRGANRERVQSVIDVAVERFAAEEALREELASTKTELADRKLIDRAKRLLIGKKGLTEPEAHHFLQDLAMKKSIRLRDAAERVLDIESLLG